MMPEPLSAGPPIPVALAGCGAVGGALVDLLSARSDEGPAEWVTLERILVRNPDKPRPASVGATPIGSNLEGFLRTDAEVVVEVVGGIDPALRIARSTLGRGASFITTNKALVARHGVELRALAEASGAHFLFEGAVGGGVPVLRTLRTSFRDVPVTRMTGVLNGTCNFVLTKMEDGWPFQEALQVAGAEGYAEADATRDLDGRDAADKIGILAWMCWGVAPGAVETYVRGLLPDPDELVAEARVAGRRVRLIAECVVEDGRPRARVTPVFVQPDSEFGRTVGVENRIRIDTQASGSYVLAGPGAGGAVTASAVLSDLRELRRSLADR